MQKRDQQERARLQRRLRSTLIGHISHGYPFRGISGNHQKPTSHVEQSSQPSAEELRQQAKLEAENLRRQAELEQELELAHDIQQGLLLAAVPYLPGWEFSAMSLPARRLGGDLYDFLPLQHGLQAIMIGDVSGKGLPAALRMAVARTVFRQKARVGESPALTLAAVNRDVCIDIPQGMVTMLYAILDPAQGIMRLSNAGHTYPILFHTGVQEFEMPGLPLGVDPDIDYDEEVLTIAPGDSVFMYTDGVNEATNPQEEEFGYERLQALLEANSQIRPRAIMKLFLRELRAWSAGGAQADDITMVVMRRRYTNLSDELWVIVKDVLGAEQAEDFWVSIQEKLPCPPSEATSDVWNLLLPEIGDQSKKQFNRGLARELNQQIRLTIEEYRTS